MSDKTKPQSTPPGLRPVNGSSPSDVMPETMTLDEIASLPVDEHGKSRLAMKRVAEINQRWITSDPRASHKSDWLKPDIKFLLDFVDMTQRVAGMAMEQCAQLEQTCERLANQLHAAQKAAEEAKGGLVLAPAGAMTEIERTVPVPRPKGRPGGAL